MSEEERKDAGAEQTAAGTAGPADPAHESMPDRAPERRDEDGLPLDRDPTLDDVRSDAGSGRAIAIGCSLLVLLLIAAFWIVRAGLLSG